MRCGNGLVWTLSETGETPLFHTVFCPDKQRHKHSTTRLIAVGIYFSLPRDLCPSLARRFPSVERSWKGSVFDRWYSDAVEILEFLSLDPSEY